MRAMSVEIESEFLLCWIYDKDPHILSTFFCLWEGLLRKNEAVSASIDRCVNIIYPNNYILCLCFDQRNLIERSTFYGRLV